MSRKIIALIMLVLFFLAILSLNKELQGFTNDTLQITSDSFLQGETFNKRYVCMDKGGNTDYANSFELQATKTCEKLGIRGTFCYYDEPKRGIYHHDSSTFPHICTALVKGKWNLSEYKEELGPLLVEYGIDVNKRGTF